MTTALRQTRCFVFAVLALSVAVRPSAAEHVARFGVRAGGGGSWLAFEKAQRTISFDPPIQGEVVMDPGPRPVLIGGMYVLFRLAGPVSIENGVSVTMRGGALRGSEALTVDGYPGVTVGFDAEEIYKRTSVDVPILIRFGQTAGPYAAYAGAGPQFSYVFFSTTDWSYNAGVGGFIPDNVVGHAEIKDQTHSMVVGLLFEAGVEFPRKTYSIVTELRFDLGLTNVYDAPAGYEEARIRDRSITFSLGALR